mgnify:CR=1 FL=1
MNFGGIGGFEILVIAAVAFMVLGPRKMADTSKAVGKTLRDLRRQRDELTAIVMQDPEDEPPLSDTPPRPSGVISREVAIEGRDGLPATRKNPPAGTE